MRRWRRFSWKKRTKHSIAMEEAREGRPDSLREELGDCAVQIVFQARVAKERNEFTIDDVIDGLHTKNGATPSPRFWRRAGGHLNGSLEELGSD
jgi:NTP pyrophosphatase (non-canonical NTP hydrolase)